MALNENYNTGEILQAADINAITRLVNDLVIKNKELKDKNEELEHSLTWNKF